MLVTKKGRRPITETLDPRRERLSHEKPPPESHTTTTTTPVEFCVYLILPFCAYPEAFPHLLKDSLQGFFFCWQKKNNIRGAKKSFFTKILNPFLVFIFFSDLYFLPANIRKLLHLPEQL